MEPTIVSREFRGYIGILEKWKLLQGLGFRVDVCLRRLLVSTVVWGCKGLYRDCTRVYKGYVRIYRVDGLGVPGLNYWNLDSGGRVCVFIQAEVMQAGCKRA